MQVRLNCPGDGGLRSAAVLLSIAASATRHGVNPWPYVRHLLAEAAARKPDADFSDLLPDAWAQAGADALPAPNRSNDPYHTPTRVARPRRRIPGPDPLAKRLS